MSASIKSELKSGTRINVPVVTQAIVQRDFAAFIALETKTSGAHAVLRRDALRLITTDTSLASEWLRQWDVMKSEGKGAEEIAKRRAASEYFREWFGIKAFSDPKAEGAARARNSLTRAKEIVQECVALHRLDENRGGFAEGFDFADDGGTYLKRGTNLAETMWKHMEYTKSDTLKADSYRERNPTVLVHSRSDSVSPGTVSWSDIRSMLLKETGQTGKGSGKAEAVADATKPLSVLRLIANTAEANKAAYIQAAAKLEALSSIEKVLQTVMSGPLFSPGWEHVEKGIAMWRDLPGMSKAVPVKGPAASVQSIADMKGADVIKLFANKSGGAITPEAAKDLPLVDVHKGKPDTAKGKPAKSVPHPKGPAAKAARKRK